MSGQRLVSVSLGAETLGLIHDYCIKNPDFNRSSFLRNASHYYLSFNSVYDYEFLVIPPEAMEKLKLVASIKSQSDFHPDHNQLAVNVLNLFADSVLEDHDNRFKGVL